MFTCDERFLCRRLAGVLGKDLAEVHVDCRGPSTNSGVRQSQELSVLGILAEVILASRNVVAELPDAVASNNASAVERVEGSRCTIIGCWYQRATSSGAFVAGRFCGRQVCFESCTVVLHIVILPG